MGVLAPTNGPVKLLTHTGPPVTADGIFTQGSQAMDTLDVLYVCTASGTPGTWVTVTAGGGGSVSSVFTRTGAVVATSGDYSVGQVTGAAPLASPAFTGSPTAPTQTPGDNTTKIATDAFVAAAIAPLAPLASPALTGSPTAPTQTPGDNTTKLATDAFVATAIANATLAILGAVYPVGSTYIETTGVNPATTFGFGTWAAFAPGQLLIGVGSFTDGSGNSQTITSGQQLGEFKHLLTSGETGTTPHGHGWTDAAHAHAQYPGNGSGGSGYVGGPSGALYGLPANNTGNNNVAVGTVNNAAAASASSSHNNIQPSFGVYIWHRTA